jgi:hypothetical protein
MALMVFLVVLVRAGERRRGRGHREHTGEQQNPDLLHFFSQ